MIYIAVMTIGRRLRALREARHLTQEEVRKRTGMLRPHISRLENGHTVPSVRTLERMARALEVPINKILLGVEQPSPTSSIPNIPATPEFIFGRTSGERRFLGQFHRVLAVISPTDRRLLFALAKKMARRTK
jgi:transcriptional regulator with XRE-family HTH domain